MEIANIRNSFGLTARFNRFFMIQRSFDHYTKQKIYCTIKMNIIRSFLLIFLSLAVLLPITSTFLFLTGTLVGQWGDPAGASFFTHFAIACTVFWFVSITGLVVTLTVEKIWEFHSMK